MWIRGGIDGCRIKLGDNDKMCIVIEYGFTINGTLRTTPCDATTSDTLGAQASITIEASDIGLPLYAFVRVTRNGSAVGNFKSAIFTPTYAPGMHTFEIPFTGSTIQTGTYAFGFDGCVFIDTESGQYCYSCTSEHCLQVIVTAPCTIPGCGFVVA